MGGGTREVWRLRGTGGGERHEDVVGTRDGARH